MKLEYIGFALIVAVFVAALFAGVQGVMGAEVFVVNTTDTIGVFRNKVNSSTANLNAEPGVVTSSESVANNFSYWTNTTGGLNGTSTLTRVGTRVNNSGTISINGDLVSTSTV